MRLFRLSAKWITIFSFALCLQVVHAEQLPTRRPLQFSMYPFIPEAEAAAYEIKARYEMMYPDVELRITLNPGYYGDEGISKDKAHVYELDSVFLADFAERLQPLPDTLAPLVRETLPMARSAAVWNGQSLGLPHWLCSNFLIFKSSDRPLAQARSLQAVEKAFAGVDDKTLLIDLKGKSTLGEMYLTSLLGNYGSAEAALAHVNPDNLDEPAKTAIRRALAMAPRWHGRDDTWHSLTGSYAREFGAGRGRALVSYSEGLHYAISESRGCRPSQDCPKPARVAAVPWPLSDNAVRQIAWVDLLVIDKAATGPTLSDATNLIKLIHSREMYRKLLAPPTGEAPRYLLPARTDIYQDKKVTSQAPLYKTFFRFIKDATPITSPDLNTKLRKIGKKLDEELPSN
jgi:thiamine pyridinylase